MSSFHSLKQIQVMDRSPQGEGAFSKVFKVKHREDNKIYALKQIDILQLSKADCDNLKLEIQLHKKLKHPNIIAFKGCLQRKNLVYMLLEQAANGSLFFYIDLNEGLPELLALRFLYETAKGIQYLHEKQIVHRDIKPENILLDKDFRVMVCDFGWSCKIKDEEVRSSICGTYEYMSPEIVYEQSHNFGVDVWCLGILLYEMLHGSPPFKAESLKEIKKEFKHRKIRVSKDYDKDTQSLINLLLQYDSRKRITVEQLLKHPAIVKNLRHFERKLTQEEFNLMRRYYYMNAGGVNLDCHNSVYARQLKRQSQLSRVDEPDSEGFVNLNISHDFGDEPLGLRFPSPENVNRAEKRFEKGNDFQPNKFLTPYGKDKERKANLNQFQPNNFFVKNEISPLQNHPKIAANAFKRKKNLENKDINQYHPPVFVSKAQKNLNKAKPESNKAEKPNDKRGKSAKIINPNKSNHERKNSSLKQKLRNQKLKQAGANINNFNPVSNHGKQANRDRGRAGNPPTSFARQIGDLRKQNQILERKAPAVLNRRRQTPTSNRVIRSASSNPSLLSHSGTRFGVNARARPENSKNSRKIEPGMTKNKHTKSQTANYWSGGVRRVSRIENKANPQISKKEPIASKDRNRGNRNRVHHRENSVSVERALNLRVIKTSSSLPKKLFGLKRSHKKTNLNNRKQNLTQKAKEAPRVLNLIKPGANLFNRKFGEKKDNNLRERGRANQHNYKNHTSINYKADEVIKEEKYLSDFQSIKSSTQKKISEKLEAQRNGPNKPENKKQQVNTMKRAQNKPTKLANQPKIMSISLKNNSNISETVRSPRANSKANINSRIQHSKASAKQVNISVLSKEPSILQIKDNSRIRQVTPSQNSILLYQNNVSNVSLGASFLNSTQFALGNPVKKDSKYVSLNDYISSNDLKNNLAPNSLQNNLTQNVLEGLNDPKIEFLDKPVERKIETQIERKKDYIASDKDERKTENLNEQSAELTRIMVSNPEPNIVYPSEERFSKTTGSANLRIQLQRARAEIESDPNQPETPGKSLFLNYDFDSRGHNEIGEALRHSNLEPRENPAKVNVLQSSQSTTTLRTGVQVVRKQAFKNFTKDTSKNKKNNVNNNNNVNISINSGNGVKPSLNNLIHKQANIQDGKLSRIHEENYSMEMATMTKTLEDKRRKKELSILGGVPRGKKQTPEIPAAFRNQKQPEIRKSKHKQKNFPTPRKSENSKKDSERRGQHRRNHSMVKRTVIINGVKTERLILSKNHHLYNRNSAQNSDQPSKSPSKNMLQNEPVSQDEPDINITNSKTGRNQHTKVNSATRYETKTGLDGKSAKWVESRQRKQNIKFGESKSQVRRVLKANRSQKVLRTVANKDQPEKKRLTLLTTRFGNIINKPEPETTNHDEPSITRRYTSNLNALKKTLNAKKRISTINSTSIGQVMPFQHDFGNTNKNLDQQRKKDDINSFISKVQRIESSKEEEVKTEQKKPIAKHKIELQNLQNEKRRFTNNETHIGVTDYSKLGERPNKSSILHSQKLSLQPEKPLNSNFNLSHGNRVLNSKNYNLANKTEIRKSEVTETLKTSPGNTNNQDLSNFQSLRSPQKIKITNETTPNLFLNKSNQRVDSHKKQYNAVRFEDSFSFPHWENNHSEQDQSNNENSISVLKDLNSIQDTPQSKSAYVSRRTTNNSNFYKKENPKPVKSQIVRMQEQNDSILKVKQDVEMVQSNILERQIKKEFRLKQNAETEKKISEKNVQNTFAGTRLYQKKNMAMHIKGGFQESGRFNRFTNYQFNKKKGNTVPKHKKNMGKNVLSKIPGPKPSQRGRLTERSNRKPHLSVNIQQLPGLKESSSMDKLTTKRYLKNAPKSPKNRKILHSKNMSMDVAKIHSQARNLAGFSTRGRTKRLQKTVDNQGNVRYKLVDKEEPPKEDNEQDKNNASQVHIRRSEISVRNDQTRDNTDEHKDCSKEPKRSEIIEKNNHVSRYRRGERSITSKLKILNRRKVSKKSDRQWDRNGRSNSRVIVRRIRRKES